MKMPFKICIFSLLFRCLVFPALADADELGRLFFTAQERAQMDNYFAHVARPEENVHALILNGIVQMHGGNRTIWINGVPQTIGRSDDKAPETAPVMLPGQNKPIKLKVGQRVLLNPSPTQDATKPDTPKP